MPDVHVNELLPQSTATTSCFHFYLRAMPKWRSSKHAIKTIGYIFKGTPFISLF